MMLYELRALLPVGVEAIRAGLQNASLTGRQQRFAGDVDRIIDVAHNVQAAEALADTLGAAEPSSQTRAVFAMLSDKDVAQAIRAIASEVDIWYISGLPGPRGMSVEELSAQMPVHDKEIRTFPDIATAYRQALADSETASVW